MSSYSSDQAYTNEVDADVSPVAREVAGLRDISGDLEKQIAVLRGRLEPLLTPSEPTPSDSAALKSAQPVVGAHCGTLGDLRDAFQSSFRRLCDITNRLEV